jgi:hypothetical protein
MSRSRGSKCPRPARWAEQADLGRRQQLTLPRERAGAALQERPGRLPELRAGRLAASLRAGAQFEPDDGLRLQLHVHERRRALGKVTFFATASLDTARDALQGDNQAISAPVKVNKGGATSAGGGPGQAEADPPLPQFQSSPLALLAVTPNPTRVGNLAIRLSLASSEAATLEVLDIAGRSVMKKNLNKFEAGVHEMSVTFDRRPEPGIYMVRLSQGMESVSSKLSVLK